MSDQFHVEAGHIRMFANSLGDGNKIYADPDYAETTEVGHVIAPPTFERAFSHFRGNFFARSLTRQRSEADQKKDESKAAAERPRPPAGGGTGLHAEQHYTYHRHPRAGETLTVTTRPGESWEKQGRRAGKLVFNESITEYRGEDNELVMTVRMVGVRTERPVDSGS
jgi:hypothetical protein